MDRVAISLRSSVGDISFIDVWPSSKIHCRRVGAQFVARVTQYALTLAEYFIAAAAAPAAAAASPTRRKILEQNFLRLA